MRTVLTFLAVAALGGTACADQAGSYPQRAKSASHMAATDGESARRWRVCARQVPDAYGAIAQAMGSDAQAPAPGPIDESAATVERTQVIAMLREAMHRTCERYLSGAISRTAFAAQAERDRRMMMTILAIEALTATPRSEPTRQEPGAEATDLADEMRPFCRRLLATADGDVRELDQACRRYLSDRARLDIQQMRASPPMPEAGTAELRQLVEDYLLSGAGTTAERWNALVRSARPSASSAHVVPADAPIEPIRARIQELDAATLQTLADHIAGRPDE